MILELIKNDNPILKQKIDLFDFGNPPIDPTELSINLYETLMSSNYVGLSAPQAGLPYRAFALRTQPGIVCFNPRIVDVSAETVLLDEVCLSFPALTLPIKRPKRIKVRYAEPNSIIKTATFDGMTARYFLHELDHLDGILYTNKTNKFHLDRALRKQTQTLRQAKANNLL